MNLNYNPCKIKFSSSSSQDFYSHLYAYLLVKAICMLSYLGKPI